MQIRREQQDWPAVYQLILSVFETRAEADIVDSSRKHATPVISIVTGTDNEVAGHILLSPVKLSGFPDTLKRGLAPMAAARQRRNNGVGKKMVDDGKEACKQLGAGSLVVLGHPD